MQEVALARSAMLCSGEKVVHWEDFADIVELFQLMATSHSSVLSQITKQPEQGHDFGDELQKNGAVLMAEMTRYLFRKNREGDIVECLKDLETLVVTLCPLVNSEPRDAIYAFLSLAADTVQFPSRRQKGVVSNPAIHLKRNWKFDYEKPVLHVFKEFVDFCIRESGSLDIICRHWAPLGSGNLPSWIGQVSHTADFTSFHTRVEFIGQPHNRVYHAAAHTKPDFKFDVEPLQQMISQLGNPDQEAHVLRPRNLWQPLLMHLEKDKTVVLRSAADLQKISLFAKGIPLGIIKQISASIAQGLITNECLKIGGWVENVYPDLPAKAPERLWRTLVADRDSTGKKPPHWYSRVCGECLSQTIEGELNVQAILDGVESSAVAQFLKRILSVTWNRKIFQAGDAGQFLGLAPANAEAGDVVCVLLGCSVPVVLRKHLRDDAEPYCELIGETFVYGVMDGEAISNLQEDELNARTTEFELR